MMRITIDLETDDSAIQDDFEYEVGKLLRKAVEKVASQAAEVADGRGTDFSFKLMDTNGNSVGTVRVDF